VVSKAIAELEYTLGVPLLDRSPRCVEPTLYGRALVASSHAVLDELRQGAMEIRHLSEPYTGELAISCNWTSVLGLVPTVIDRLRIEHPGVMLHLTQHHTLCDQHRELRERRIELAVGDVDTRSVPEDIAHEILFDDHLCIVASRQSPWAGRGRVELAALADAPWVLPAANTPGGQAAADVFRCQGLAVPRAHVTAPFLLIPPLLENGPFVSVLPRSVLSLIESGAGPQVLSTGVTIPAGQVGVMRLKNRQPGPLALLVIDLLRSVARHEPVDRAIAA
jgi:DNA-binding transcriptional LysR family regulator